MTAIPCPTCGEALEGSGCPACGGRAVVALEPNQQAPTCCAHAGRRASAPCARCGRFCCAVCFHGARGGLLCRLCRPKPQGVPWEGGSFPSLGAYLRTAWGFLAAPSELASRLEAGRGSLRALLFGSVTIMLGTVSNFALLRALLDPPQREKVPEAILLFWVCSLLGWQVVVPLGDQVQKFDRQGSRRGPTGSPEPSPK